MASAMAGGADLTFCIVIETDNLTAVDETALARCVESLAAQGPILARADAVFLVDHGVASRSLLAALQARYRWLTVLPAAAGTSYIELKATGAVATKSDIVVLCDCDIRYEPGWLAALLDGFRQRPEAWMIAGETSTPIRGPYSLAFGLTFIFPRFTGETELAPTTTYWANNVAVHRELIESLPIPDPAELYRGQNLIHTLRLRQAGRVLLRQPQARAWHEVIPLREIVWRYYVLGRDAGRIRQLTRREAGRVYLGAMAPDTPGGGGLQRLRDRMRQLMRGRSAALLLLPFSVPVVALFVLCYGAGRLSVARLGAAADVASVGDATQPRR